MCPSLFKGLRTAAFVAPARAPVARVPPLFVRSEHILRSGRCGRGAEHSVPCAPWPCGRAACVPSCAVCVPSCAVCSASRVQCVACAVCSASRVQCAVYRVPCAVRRVCSVPCGSLPFQPLYHCCSAPSKPMLQWNPFPLLVLCRMAVVSSSPSHLCPRRCSPVFPLTIRPQSR